MQYEMLLSELLSLIPDQETIIRELMKENLVEEDDGMHIVLGLVIVPLIGKWCKNDEQTALRLFDFFENMAHSNDTGVLEVLDFSVLEPIADMDESDRKTIEKYMKAETMDRYQYIRNHMFR